MTRTLSRWQAILLGAILLVGLMLAGIGLFTIGSRQWYADALHLQAQFRHVGGVEVGTRVHIQGIDAGEVVSIDIPTGPNEPVVVRMQVDGRFRHLIREDSKVQITGESLFGGKVITVLPGSAQANMVEDHAQLATLNGGDLTVELASAAGKLNSFLERADNAMIDFEKGRGPIGEATRNLQEASQRLNRVLAKAEFAVNEIDNGKGTFGKLLKDDKLYNDLSIAVTQLNSALTDIRNGEGTIGKLVKDNAVYNETIKSLQDVRQMVASVKQNSDAIKSLPVVRNYVVDVNKELNRPDWKRYRIYFTEERLFEPGKAVLTAEGQKALDYAAQWLNDRKDAGSEVVVATFADPKYNADFAQTLSQKQSDAVVEYLRSTHLVHRMGFWWWSNRTVKSLGCGNAPTPVPEKEQLPAARVELIVFVPTA